jgi:hypothetical protein
MTICLSFSDTFGDVAKNEDEDPPLVVMFWNVASSMSIVEDDP